MVIANNYEEGIDWTKPLFTAKEVKVLLGIKDNTFRKWIREGYISYTQVPGSSKIYIQKEHLIDFLNDTRFFYPRQNVA